MDQKKALAHLLTEQKHNKYTVRSTASDAGICPFSFHGMVKASNQNQGIQNVIGSAKPLLVGAKKKN